MEPAPTTRITRQSNKFAHPGLPDVDETILLKKPHRTKAQIAVDNKEKAQKKEDKAAADKEQELKKALGVKKVAAMQNQMHAEDIQSNLQAARPPAKKTAKVARPVVDNSAESTILAEDRDLERTVFCFSDNDIRSEDESELSETSSMWDMKFMQYAQDPYGDIPVDVPIDGPVDEPVDGPVEGVMKVKGKGKQSKVKVDSREVINKERRALLVQASDTSDLSDEVVVVQKHKADASDEVNPRKIKKEKTSLPLTGLEGGPAKTRPIKTKKITVISDVEADEVPVTGAKRKAVTEDKASSKKGKQSPPAGLKPDWKPAIVRCAPADPLAKASLPAPSCDANVVDKIHYTPDSDQDDTKERLAVSSIKLEKDTQVVFKSLAKVRRNGPAASDQKHTTSTSSQPGKAPRASITNADLPAGTHREWHANFVPAWIQFMGTTANPWILVNYVTEAQNLWDNIFPDHSHVFSATKDPLFSLLRQRTYEWRGNFANVVGTAVQTFWDSDPIYNDPEERRNYVEWAVPTSLDDPSPFLWTSVDEANPNDIRYKGAFQSQMVMETFMHHIAIVDDLAPEFKINDNPRGALAMAVTAVERALKCWVTGFFVKDTIGFTGVWSEATAHYSEELATPGQKWNKILVTANHYHLESKKRNQLKIPVNLVNAPSRCHQIVDDDSD